MELTSVMDDNDAKELINTVYPDIKYNETEFKEIRDETKFNLKLVDQICICKGNNFSEKLENFLQSDSFKNYYKKKVQNFFKDIIDKNMLDVFEDLVFKFLDNPDNKISKIDFDRYWKVIDFRFFIINKVDEEYLITSSLPLVKQIYFNLLIDNIKGMLNLVSMYCNIEFNKVIRGFIFEKIFIVNLKKSNIAGSTLKELKKNVGDDLKLSLMKLKKSSVHLVTEFLSLKKCILIEPDFYSEKGSDCYIIEMLDNENVQLHIFQITISDRHGVLDPENGLIIFQEVISLLENEKNLYVKNAFMYYVISKYINFNV